MIWNTFLGGTDGDVGTSIAVGRNGNIFLTGSSGSSWGSPVLAFPGSQPAAFVAELDSAGKLKWNTFLAGSQGATSGNGIFADENNNIYVTGSSDESWGDPIQASSGHDAFVAKLDTSGKLLWNTFLGGGYISPELPGWPSHGEDSGNGIAVDGTGNAYVIGSSSDPWGDPVQPTDRRSAFVAKLDSVGNLTWNTFLGYYGTGIVLDREGSIFVTGDWPDAFAAGLSSSGNLNRRIFLGGDGYGVGNGISVDGSRNVYVVGNMGTSVAFVTMANFSSIFADVPENSWELQYIESIYYAGITAGCNLSPLVYCPTNSVTRAQMAVFLLRGIHGSDYVPPAAMGIFEDVALASFAAPWIEQLYNEGITGGCSTTPMKYCPNNPVTRAQMAIFLLRAEHGSDYTPPAAVGKFEDVPAETFTAPFIEQLSNEGITGGCSITPILYCPSKTVTRDQMAVFLVRTFSLP